MNHPMQAAWVERFGEPLVLREGFIASPGAGQILVRTEACGVSHGDLHAARGDWPLRPRLPFIPGHEAVGRVASLGAGVKGLKEGDRVGVPWLHSACGHCEHCLAGAETVCAEAEFSGFTKNGGLAGYILADPGYVVRIPAGLSAAEAAPIVGAGVASYEAILQTGARAGEWLAISGIGGLGHLAIQYARAMGLHVCAIDVDEGKLEHASQLGAEFVVNASRCDAVAAVRKATCGGAHGVLVTAPVLAAFEQGLGMTRKRGTFVLVGLPPGAFPMPLFDVVASGITLRGSYAGARRSLAPALAFAEERQVRAGIELQPLSAINDVLGRLAAGDVASRVVIDFASR